MVLFVHSFIPLAIYLILSYSFNIYWQSYIHKPECQCTKLQSLYIVVLLFRGKCGLCCELSKCISVIYSLDSVTWYYILISIFDPVFFCDTGNRIKVCRVGLNQVTKHLEIRPRVINNPKGVIINKILPLYTNILSNEASLLF